MALPYTLDFSRDTLLENAYELIEAGVPIIQLHPMDDSGNCLCGIANCSSTNKKTGEIRTLAGKHPMSSRWQSAPIPDDEKGIETACFNLETSLNPNSTGLGAVLPDDILIVDVDCKNGKVGASSLVKLERAIGSKLSEICGYQVISGSGAPSAHYWFKKPAGVSIRKTMKEYPDIDFLHKGNYVVIEGSCHQSGGMYTAKNAKSSIKLITPAPASLIDIIERKQVNFGEGNLAEAGSCDMADIQQALDYIMQDYQGEVPYDDWFRICMGLHFETGGSDEGYQLFDSWSQQGINYTNSNDTRRKWEEGSKTSESKISGATILYMAQELGWVRDYGVEVDMSGFIESLKTQPKAKIVSKSGSELQFGDIPEEMKSFRGAAGLLLDWSLNNSKKPSYTISLASVLHTLSVVLGRDFCTDTESYASLYQMVVAKTGRGKEQPMKVFSRCSSALQERYPTEKTTLMTDATSVGAMVSELEINPRKGVVLDEIGHILEAISKVKGDRNSIELSSFYLQVFGRLDGEYVPKSMSKRGLSKEDRAKLASESERILRPAVSMIGMTTPVKFMDVLTREMMQDGFINRFLMWFPQEGRQPVILDSTKPIPERFWEWAENVYIRLRAANGGDPASVVRDDPLNPLKPVVVKVKGTEAESIWREFESYCDDVAEGLESQGFEDVYARAPEIAMRLALILQLADKPFSEFIEAETMRQAVAMVKFSKADEIKCYLLEHSENSVEKREKLIYNEIVKGGFKGITLSDLFNSRACSGLKPREVSDFVMLLKEKEKVIIEDNNSGKGRPNNKKKIVYSTEYKQYEGEE